VAYVTATKHIFAAEWHKAGGEDKPPYQHTFACRLASGSEKKQQNVTATPCARREHFDLMDDAEQLLMGGQRVATAPSATGSEMDLFRKTGFIHHHHPEG
jgi:hypothetical protein